MGKQEKIDNLTWKYFRSQKKKELGKLFKVIGWGLLVIFIVVYIALSMVILMSFLFGVLPHLIYDSLKITFISLERFCIIFFSLTIILFFTINWLYGNYTEANRKAKRYVNKKPKGGKKK